MALGLATASLLFWGFYSPTIGPISPPLEKLGLIDDPIQFLETSLSALLSTTFLIVWKYAGFYMLILLVGLQAIPHEVYEAAALDGASRWQTFRRITLPLLRPSLALALILCVTGSLLAFDQFYILTKGAPGQHAPSRSSRSSTARRSSARTSARPRRSRSSSWSCCCCSTRSSSAACASAERELRPAMRTSTLGRTPYYVLTGGLAIIFLFPLLWSVGRIGEPAGRHRHRSTAIGLGNYTTLFNYGAGLPQYVFNSVVVSVLTVVITLVRLDRSAATPSPASRSRAGTCCSC